MSYYKRNQDKIPAIETVARLTRNTLFKIWSQFFSITVAELPDWEGAYTEFSP